MDAPSKQDILRIAEANGFPLNAEELEVFGQSLAQSVRSYDRIAQLPEPRRAPERARNAGWAPQAQDNPYGAWAWRSSIKTKSSGALAGKRIVIKDNVAVAGLPLRNGSSLLEGYTPEEDATVVTRILEAGGEIVGKSVSENLCFSGGSHTSEPGPVLNPHNVAHMAGGSSSGSGALLAAGACDMAIGGDQGGSVRIPSAWCGVFGLKPTWGLVPYTGAFPIEPSLDHLGPMATDVTGVATLLEVIAGRDDLDARQGDAPFEPREYVSDMKADSQKLRVGILHEGFGFECLSQPRVEEMVRAAAHKFQSLGMEVSEISVPSHLDGLDIWTGIATEGGWSTMVRGNSAGHGAWAAYDTPLTAQYGAARKKRPEAFSATVKTVIILGQYLDEKYHGTFYTKAQNLRRTLRAAYDRAFESVDLLLMPTTPFAATALPTDGSLKTYLDVALNMMSNTAAFDASGHPAMSIPCGRIDGLPVGMMLVGRRFAEATILKAAYAFEQAGHSTL